MRMSIEKLENCEKLPKRFHWLNTFVWTTDTFVAGRLKLEKLTSAENPSFERCKDDVKRTLIQYQNKLDQTFYYNDLVGFQQKHAPEHKSGKALSQALDCVLLMRMTRRPGLRRDTVPMVGLDWYARSLQTLWRTKVSTARTHTRDFLQYDYHFDECKAVCETAYHAELHIDPAHAPLWLSYLTLRRYNTKVSAHTTALCKLLAKHPQPEQAWSRYYTGVLMACALQGQSYAGVYYEPVDASMDDLEDLCKRQIAFGKKTHTGVILESVKNAFLEVYAEIAQHGAACDGDVLQKLENMGWGLLDAELGASLDTAKALDMSLLELFSVTLPTPLVAPVTLPAFDAQHDLTM